MKFHVDMNSWVPRWPCLVLSFFWQDFAASSSKHEDLNQVGEPKCDIAMAFMAFMAICSFLSMTTLLLFPQAAAGGDVCTDCDDVELLQFKDDQRALETFLTKTTREAYQTNVHPYLPCVL